MQISVQEADFDSAAEALTLTSGRNDIGAVVTFEGRVRADNGLTALRLEHYPGMTEAEIARHVDTAQARWPLLGVRIIHRIGRLGPGARIVLVITAAAHRRGAFEAADFLMDYLKTRAPFWKQEQYGDDARWVDAKLSDLDAARRWQKPGQS
ncbi:MAG: molybdenum cofactor biosynthesis protein MoaE [Rhizomicrobium sp.]